MALKNTWPAATMEETRAVLNRYFQNSKVLPDPPLATASLVEIRPRTARKLSNVNPTGSRLAGLANRSRWVERAVRSAQ